MDDTISEAFVERTLPISVALCMATHAWIKHGFLKVRAILILFNSNADESTIFTMPIFHSQNNGLGGLMRKYFVCMVAGGAVSLIGIRGYYHDKLALFYRSQQYDRVLQARRKQKAARESESSKKFVKVKWISDNISFGSRLE